MTNNIFSEIRALETYIGDLNRRSNGRLTADESKRVQEAEKSISVATEKVKSACVMVEKRKKS